MNLLDKRTTNKIGLAMLSALFFLFSCEEPTEIGLDLNPNKGAVSTHYVEIPLETSQYYNDSIFSAVNVPVPFDVKNILPVPIGRSSSPQFGELSATAYTNIGSPGTANIPAGAQPDSAFLFLSYNSNYVGSSIDATQSLEVYRLQAPITPTSSTMRETSSGMDVSYLSFSYYAFEERELSEQVGQITFDTSEVADKTLKIPIDPAFAQELLTKVQQSDSTFLNDQQAFDAFARGLAIVPGEENTFVNTYNLVRSGISVYYQRNDTTRTLSFPLSPKNQSGTGYNQFPTYYHLETDYSNTALVNIPEGVRGRHIIETTDSLLYFRTGVGLYPKVSFTALENFLNSDTIGSLVINQAVLEIDSIKAAGENQPIPGQLGFFFTDTNNKLLTSVNPSEANAQRYVRNQQDTLYNYRANLVLQLEQYIRTTDPSFLQGRFQAGNTAPFTSFVTDPERIKLKIYYTSFKKD
jgi:hypothetical protein